MTAREALARAAELLRLAGVDEALREARILLEHALLEHVPGLTRARLLARPDFPLDAPTLARYDALVGRRARREPLPYILGHQPFRRLDLLADARALIPRPETELLVEIALTLALSRREREQGQRPARDARVAELTLSRREREQEQSVADVGTGSGAIAVSLAVEAPGLRVYATDISPDALALAGENARRHGVADRVAFLLGDLLDPLPEPVDLIVANLPYVPTGELATQPELGWEPRLALDGGPDGLDACRRLLERAPSRLRTGGACLFEIGAEQGAAALCLARAAFPGAEVRLHRDLAGRDRVVEVRVAGGEARGGGAAE